MKLPDKKYQVILADPPWKMKNKKTGGSMKSGADNQYSTMTLDDLKALPVSEIADDNCYLFMWWLGSMPQEAIDLVTSWGFTLKNMNGLVWAKQTVTGKPFFGMGFHTRAGSESAIIAVKGKPKRVSGGVRAVRTAKILAHSEKPAEFHDDIVKLCGDVPRIELFARRSVEGWDCWGNEVDQASI